MYRYYKESNDDFMEVNEATSRYAEMDLRYDVRATALEGMPRSVQTTTASWSYISECVEVKRSEVPIEWARMFDGFTQEELQSCTLDETRG